MKKEFITELEKIAKKDKKIFFLTGDLGFNAFEGIRYGIGERFINAGVAEQNMISVAAGLCYVGLKPWVYSISTFLTLKTVEQVRNDVCHLNLPVKLAGFGGGYGYGIMGESHHLLEDVAIYSSFPNMQLYIPAFVEDMPFVVEKIYKNNAPSYLRLNLAPQTTIQLPPYAPIRHIKNGEKITLVVLGPLIHNVLQAIDQLKEENVIDLFVITELPTELSDEIFVSIRKTQKLLVVEEHSGVGGLGEKLFSILGKRNLSSGNFVHLFAKGYLSHLYGNHAFHQKENELDPEGILKNIKRLL